MEETELTEEQLKQIKICFNEMVKNKKSSVDLKLDLKSIEDNLKQDVAEVKQYKKSDNTIDLKRVKGDLLKAAIKSHYEKKKSKLQEKADILEEYINDIEKKSYNTDIIDTYLNKEKVLEDNKNDYKDIVDNYSSLLDKDTLKALDKIVNFVQKDYLKEQQEKINEKNGKKKKKNSSKISNVDTIVAELMKKLGIDL